MGPYPKKIFTPFHPKCKKVVESTTAGGGRDGYETRERNPDLGTGWYYRKTIPRSAIPSQAGTLPPRLLGVLQSPRPRLLHGRAGLPQGVLLCAPRVL